MNEKEALDRVKEICESNSYVEMCGYLGFNHKSKNFMVELHENISEQPDKFFMMDPLEYLMFKDKYEMVAVFHSHIEGDEKPSEFDIKMSEDCCDPFLIYSLITKKVHIYEPKNITLDVSILNRIKDCNDQN